MALPTTQMPIRIYNSVHEFCNAPDIADFGDRIFTAHLNHAEKNAGGQPLTEWHTNNIKQQVMHWYGGRDFKASKEYFQRGADEDEIADARALMNQIDVEIHGVHGEVWKPQVYGAYPCVPDYLAGDPMCMRMKELDESEQAPVRVVLDIGVPARTSHRVIAKRAAAATAFAMKLSEQRPVELWIADAGYNEKLRRDYGWRCKLDMPTNISQVMAAFNPSVNRMMMLHFAEQISGGTNSLTEAGLMFVLNGVAGEHGELYRQELVKYLQLDKDDIVLHTLLNKEDMAQIDRNPAKWVMDMLTKYGVQAEDY